MTLAGGVPLGVETSAKEREAQFQEWWEKYGQPYEAAVLENGDQPWTTDVEARRRLWMRRYTRPAPPAGLTNDLDVIRRGRLTGDYERTAA